MTTIDGAAGRVGREPVRRGARLDRGLEVFLYHRGGKSIPSSHPKGVTSPWCGEAITSGNVVPRHRPAPFWTGSWTGWRGNLSGLSHWYSTIWTGWTGSGGVNLVRVRARACARARARARAYSDVPQPVQPVQPVQREIKQRVRGGQVGNEPVQTCPKPTVSTGSDT